MKSLDSTPPPPHHPSLPFQGATHYQHEYRFVPPDFPAVVVQNRTRAEALHAENTIVRPPFARVRTKTAQNAAVDDGDRYFVYLSRRVTPTVCRFRYFRCRSRRVMDVSGGDRYFEYLTRRLEQVVGGDRYFVYLTRRVKPTVGGIRYFWCRSRRESRVSVGGSPRT